MEVVFMVIKKRLRKDGVRIAIDYLEARNRLVLENCEKCFNIEDCLENFKSNWYSQYLIHTNFECYKYYHPSKPLKDPIYMGDIIKSWEEEGN